MSRSIPGTLGIGECAALSATRVDDSVNDSSSSLYFLQSAEPLTMTHAYLLRLCPDIVTGPPLLEDTTV